MGWMGKLIGGTLGFMLGGPIGAIAGAAFGHTIDKSSEIGSSQAGTGTYQRTDPFGMGTGGFGGAVSAQQRSQMVFFVGTFSMLARVAAADGNVSDAEMRKIREFMRQDLRLDPQSVSVAERIFNSALYSSQKLNELAGQFYGEFRSQPQILELLIDILYRVAAVDGGVDQAEENIIIEAARIFHYSQQRIDTIRSRYVSSNERYYAVLGVTASASDDEIKKAYRQLVREYHPDTIASKGLPEEFTTFANEKFREIQEAYEAVEKARGL